MWKRDFRNKRYLSDGGRSRSLLANKCVYSFQAKEHLTRTEPARASLISGCSSVCVSGIISKTAWKSFLNNILYINRLIIIIRQIEIDRQIWVRKSCNLYEKDKAAETTI